MLNKHNFYSSSYTSFFLFIFSAIHLYLFSLCHKNKHDYVFFLFFSSSFAILCKNYLIFIYFFHFRFHVFTLRRPSNLSVVWTRRSRRVASAPLPWEPDMMNPLVGNVSWPVPDNHCITVTLFKDPRTHELEDKDWTFVIEDVSIFQFIYLSYLMNIFGNRKFLELYRNWISGNINPWRLYF